MTEKRTVLFLAYYFPPSPAIGSVRAANIAKQLLRKGFNVIVVTPHRRYWRFPRKNVWPYVEGGSSKKMKLVETGHYHRYLSPDYMAYSDSFALRFLGGIARKFARRLGLERELGWKVCALRAIKDLEDNVDLILATASPFLSFGLAEIVSQSIKAPFVLDYRDPWSGNPHDDDLTAKEESIVSMERRIVAQASAITIVSPSWAKALSERYPDDATKICVLSNGYDPTEFEGIEPTDFGHTSIVYAGNFYPPKRVIQPVMRALGHLSAKDLCSTGPIRFHYYGEQISHVTDIARKEGVSDMVICHGKVDRREVFAAIKGATVNTVITSVLPKATLADKGILTGKLYESIALRANTLVIAPGGSDAEKLVNESGVGFCVSGDSIESIAGYFWDSANGRKVGGQGSQLYSWDVLGEHLAEVFERVIAEGRVKR